MSKQDDKKNVELIKNQVWNAENLKTEKINKLLINIPVDNITEQNEVINVGKMLISRKIGIFLKNPKRKTKNSLVN